MKNTKYFLAGAVLSTFVIGAVSVNAFNLELFGVKNNDSVKIEFDGVVKPLPENMHILNYKDSNYTSARFIAESLGATVDYDEDTNTISLTAPSYEIETVYIEPESFYAELPLTYRDSYYKVELKDAYADKNSAIELEVLFEKVPEGKNTILYEEAYLEYGDKRALIDDSKTLNTESISNGITRTIRFLPLDIDKEKIKYAKVVLPLRFYDKFRYENIDTYLTYRINLD